MQGTASSTTSPLPHVNLAVSGCFSFWLNFSYLTTAANPLLELWNTSLLINSQILPKLHNILRLDRLQTPLTYTEDPAHIGLNIKSAVDINNTSKPVKSMVLPDALKLSLIILSVNVLSNRRFRPHPFAFPTRRYTVFLLTRAHPDCSTAFL